ncbi:MAG: flocculation-associated PEP-CTERM protein PepA [Gammaproteobacteria bacterium]
MKISSAIPITLVGLLAAGTANASWVGTANYGIIASGAPTVGPFDAYGIGTGDVLLQRVSGSGTPSAPQVGDTYNGYFQSYIFNHTLNGNTIGQGNLNNTANSGTPYELTIAGSFTETVTGVGSGVAQFSITSGSAQLYASSTVNYNFLNNGTGFTDGTSILTGNFVSGIGTFGPAGFGVSSLTINVPTGGYNSSVYSPGIGGGTALITLQGAGSGGSTSFLNNVTGVGTHTAIAANGDILLASVGNLELAPVPLPAAIWLFGSGLVGLVGVSRRRRPN